MMNSGDYGLPYRWRARRRGLNGARAWTEGLRAGRAERLVAAARRELGRARAGWRALPGPPSRLMATTTSAPPRAMSAACCEAAGVASARRAARGVKPEMETWDAITSRRNVRRFADRSIPADHLDRVLEAGRRAPSSQNNQPWDFVLVTERWQLR